MTLKNHPFFKKHNTFKWILLLHLIFSLAVLISNFVYGYIYHDNTRKIESPLQNFKALYNPEKYLKNDLFAIDTVFTEEVKSGSSNTRSTYTTIRGNLVNSKIKQEIICSYDNLNHFYSEWYSDDMSTLYNRRVKTIKVWKNSLNDKIFLKEEKYIWNQKFSAIATLYLQFSFIPLIILLLILKKKSEAGIFTE